jgi:hypothetical protein
MVNLFAIFWMLWWPADVWTVQREALETLQLPFAMRAQWKNWSRSQIGIDAILPTMMAAPITSAGRFSPLGGIGKHPYYFFQVFVDGHVIAHQTYNGSPIFVIPANYADVLWIDVNVLVGGAALGN